MKNNKTKGWKKDLPIHIVLGFLVFFTFYLLVFLFITSFKDIFQFVYHFWGVTFPLHFSNYVDAWGQVYPYLLNSAVVSISSLAGVLILASLSAYAFARFSFPGKEILFFAIISLLMIPWILTLIPRFLLVRDLGLLNTRWALILNYVAGGQIFAIFILRSFFASLPEEFFEAARIDGASEIQCFVKILLPLSKPILITIAIMNLINTWNNYIWPLVTLSDDKLWTIPLGLFAFQGRYATLWGPLFAGYLIASIPLIVLFFFTMRYFIAGLSSGALKM